MYIKNINIVGFWFINIFFILVSADQNETESLCMANYGLIYCNGSNITRFPHFTQHTAYATFFVHIMNTNMGVLPFFKKNDWPFLFGMSVTNNSNITCEDIRDFKKNHTFITIYDCRD